MNTTTSKIRNSVLLTSIPQKTSETKWFIKEGYIYFYNQPTRRTGKVENENFISVIDVESGKIELQAPLNSLFFKKEWMDGSIKNVFINCMNYPDLKFSGIIHNNQNVNYMQNGIYQVKCKGKLTLYGYTKSIETNATIYVEGKWIRLQSTLHIIPSDFNLDSGKIVVDKFKKEIQLDLNCSYQQFFSN